ncbi:MAG TPA: NapC/NirT family cytochrome c [Terriglobia bacterium]|nr:NapC/NirT family cytochrome c [Terriglobia bacterium]
MATSTLFEVLFIGMALALAALVAFRAELTRARGGKILAFFTLFILPVLAVGLGYSEHMQRAESTQFCLSCHVMHDFGRSLYVDDPSYIPARHFQNRLVPRDHACYTCHTDYTMFGTVDAKLRGLRHMYVEYLGKVPAPADIKLYTPFNNRECLYCHAGARAFEEEPRHTKTPDMMSKIMSNQMSCMAAKCHDTVHDVDTLKDATFWKGGEQDAE